MATLKEISDNLEGAVAAAGPAVLRIEARHGAASTGIAWGGGLVLTAAHALHYDEGISVNDGERGYPAQLVGRDPASDLAVLRADELGAERPALAAAGARPGQLALAIGRPAGLEVTFGVVSGSAEAPRGWRGGVGGELIRVDAPLNRGFSGGPLVDAEGAVLGFNSWYYGRGTTLALAIAGAGRIAEHLARHGHVRRSYLGIGAQVVELPEAVAGRIGRPTGLMVVSTDAGGPAAAAGILQGDVLVSLAGHPTARMRDLVGALAALDVDTSHPAEVVRAGQETTISVTLAERQPAGA